MWLFCKQGFFSAVEHRDNASIVLIRARFPGDLSRLQAYSVDLSLKSCGKIQKTPHADYPFRMTMSKSDWAVIVSNIAAEIDYDNFKDSVHEGNRSPRDAAYMNCRAALRHAQQQ